MGNVFNTTQVKNPKRNTFDLSHDLKYSCDMGKLVPIFLQEVLPKDSFNISTQTLIRFAPLTAPVMHNIKCFVHYFFVPNRIVWPNFEDFISPDLSKSEPPAWPYFDVDDTTEYGALAPVGSIADYFGIPTETKVGRVSAIPHAGYNKIFNEYYRDQNLVAPLPDELINGDNGADFGASSMPRQRAWQHDYFTSALPFAQKGPTVDIPLGGDGVYPVLHNNATGEIISWPGTTAPSGTSQRSYVQQAEIDGIAPDNLFVNTDTANATINDLRVAMRLQEWFELAARGGSRYVEQLLVHWGVKSSDARLQRPEFLGGSRVPVIISEVLQTSETDDTSGSTPQGTMTGHALSVDSGKNVRYYAEEHGYIIGILSIMPSTAYQQGVPRHFSRKSWEDYAWPTFAHLGEQAILNKEIYADGTTVDNETFGYIPRYSEYRYQASRVAGDFRTSLNYWHMGRIFENRPQLNNQFIESNPTKRIFAVEDEETQSLWCHSHHKVFVKRALPKYGTPTL